VKFAAASLHRPVSAAQRMPSKKTVRMGDEGKAVRRGERRDGFAVPRTLRRSPDLCILTWIKDADCDPMVGIVSCVFAKGAVVFLRAGQPKATHWVAFFFPAARLLIPTQYEIPFKLSMTTFQISIMAITPAMASHKARHPSCNFSVFMAEVR
jgi:hypothetical protein